MLRAQAQTALDKCCQQRHPSYHYLGHGRKATRNIREVVSANTMRKSHARIIRIWDVWFFFALETLGARLHYLSGGSLLRLSLWGDGSFAIPNRKRILGRSPRFSTFPLFRSYRKATCLPCCSFQDSLTIPGYPSSRFSFYAGRKRSVLSTSNH